MPPKNTAQSAAPTKVAPKAAAPVAAEVETTEEAPKATRVKLSDLPQEERDAKAQELIDQLYGEGTAQEEKSKIRQRLRNIDKTWRTTYAEYVSTNYPSATASQGEGGEEAAAAAPAPKAAPAKPAVTKAAPAAAAPAPTGKKVASKR